MSDGWRTLTFPIGLLGVLMMMAFVLELNLLESSSGSRNQSALVFVFFPYFYNIDQENLAWWLLKIYQHPQDVQHIEWILCRWTTNITGFRWNSQGVMVSAQALLLPFEPSAHSNQRKVLLWWPGERNTLLERSNALIYCSSKSKHLCRRHVLTSSPSSTSPCMVLNKEP